MYDPNEEILIKTNNIMSYLNKTIINPNRNFIEEVLILNKSDKLGFIKVTSNNSINWIEKGIKKYMNTLSIK